MSYICPLVLSAFLRVNKTVIVVPLVPTVVSQGIKFALFIVPGVKPERVVVEYIA